ncbi:MAG: S8 family serine peptidase [Desulfobacteraceae bacterium]|nr:S8 family serine peptidase [Desulfobacteraceae bacterium]
MNTDQSKRDKKGSRIPVVEGEWQGRKVTYRADRIVVGVKGPPGVAVSGASKLICDAILKTLPDARILRYPKRSRVAVFRVPEGSDIPALAQRIAQRDDVRYAEPDIVGEICVTPNDPRFSDQWGPEKIDAEGAWDLETGGAGILIGVIDTGIATDAGGTPNHADLDDTARYILGTDFVGDDALPRDDHGHGTHVAGIAAAETDNSSGIAGMNWGSPVYICKVFDSSGNGSESDVEAAVQEIVDHAVNNNLAAVINMSARWTSPATALRDACDYANDHGMIFCVATGNVDGPVGYPAAYSVDFEGVVAVGSTDDNDSVSDFSNTGPEVTVVAPGRGILSTMPPYAVTLNSYGYSQDYAALDGTSMASPHVAGLAALVWSRVPRLNNDQVRDVVMNTAVKLGAGAFSNDWGHGRVDAAQAVMKAGWEVTLETANLVFMDVPEGETTARAVKFNVRSFHVTRFEIVSGPSGGFSVLSSASVSLGKSTDYDTPRAAYLWISYTGTTDGDTAAGSVTVRCVDTEEQWDIPISANTIARPTVATVLALDQSNSMHWASGLPGLSRSDVLRFAAPVFVNLLQENNGIGIVAFDHDAYDRMAVQAVGPPSAFDPVRGTALGVIAAHTPNPAGNTAIGDGLENAHNMLNATTGYDYLAIVVFTDGFETAAKYIADVAPLINERVFAIGLGTADQIQPASLTALTNGTGGYILLTGAMGPDDLFRLSKYYLQILAGITNQDIVLDPEGALKPGQKQRIDFDLNEADIGVDAILLGEANLQLFKFALETPAGDVITPAVAGATAGIDYIGAQGVSFYRGILPVPIGAAGAREGKWHALLSVDAGNYKRYLGTLEKHPDWYKRVLAHGVRYSLSVQSYSGLRLQAQLLQSSQEPGATLTVRAVLTEYGLPIPSSRANVRAEFKRPDTTGGVLMMPEEQPGSGIYTASMPAPLSGVYPFRILAEGKSLRGREFTREHLLTGAVWKGGDNPPPTGKDDPNEGKERLCRLLSCLLSGKVIQPEFEGRLKQLGISLEALRECLKVWCRPAQQAFAASPFLMAQANPSAAPAGTGKAITAQAVELILQLAREFEEKD